MPICAFFRQRGPSGSLRWWIRTETEQVLPSDTLNSRLSSIEEDGGGREVCGQAEEAMVKELHDGPPESPEVVGER